jgi:hypothetical protein
MLLGAGQQDTATWSLHIRSGYKKMANEMFGQKSWFVAACLTLSVFGFISCAQRAVPDASSGGPRSPQNEIIGAVLVDVLKKPPADLRPVDGRLLLNVTGAKPRRQLRVPSQFLVVNQQQLEALANRRGVRATYLSVRLELVGPQKAIVVLGVYPATKQGELAVCCHTQRREYTRDSRGVWTFSGTLSTVIH